MYKLFTCEHSHFSAKVRAYLKWKRHYGALGDGFEDILATQELIRGLLIKKSGAPSLPQLEAPDGTWVQDSSDIIDYIETQHPASPVVPDPATSPRQCLSAYLLELLADEWMLVTACWNRWHHTKEGNQPSHQAYNEQQWGSWLAPESRGLERRQAGAQFFEEIFGISETQSNPKGPFAGLLDLGFDETTKSAWLDSQERLLTRLEAHFDAHDYILGGQPSLAEFALLGPLYVHYYRDAVPGFMLRTRFPLVAEWIERTNAEGALNARWYGQKLYSLDAETGGLTARPATSDGGKWLPDDTIPLTLLPVLAIFFEEMWPVLCDASAVLSQFIASDAHEPGGELPRKSFTATPGFLELQKPGGALNHEFEIGGICGNRMVVPNQMWMLQRVARGLSDCIASPAGRSSVEEFLSDFPNGPELLTIDTLIADCHINKVGGQLFSVLPATSSS